MWRPAEAPFVALLVLFHTVLTGGEILSDVEVPKPSLAVSTISSTLISTVTHSGTIYVLAPQATFSPFGPEHIMNKRNPLSFHVDGQVEATVVIAPAPVSAAWTTFIEPQDAIPSGYGGSSVPGTSSGPYPTNGVGTSPAGSPGGNAGNGPAGNPSGGNGSGSGPGDTGGAPAGNTPGPESGNSPGGNTGGSPVGGNPGSNNNPNSPNNGSGSGPESSGTNPSSSGGTGPGADSGNIPSGNSSDNGTGAGGQPSLPSGAYGQQPPSPSSQETAGPVGQQPPIPAATQTASSLGQQTTNPASWGLPTPTGEGSPSPTGGQSPSGQPTPVALTTIVSALGTVVETVTVTLQSAPGNVPLATPSSSSPGAWSPFSAPNGQPQPITPGTFPSTTCDSSIPTDVISGSAAAPWGVMSAANTPPTTFVTVPSVTSSILQSLTSYTPTVVIVTAPGGQGPVSAPTSLSIPVPGNSPGWATTPGATVTVSYTPGATVTVSYTPGAVGSTIPGWDTSTCTTGIFTDVISTSVTRPSSSTSGATILPVDPTISVSHTAWTISPSTAPVPITNAGITANKINVPILCGLISLAVYAEIAGRI